MLEVKRKEGENVNAFLFRFNKRVQRSGLVKETRKRQFKTRSKNKTKRRLGALYRISRKQELMTQKKQGR